MATKKQVITVFSAIDAARFSGLSLTMVDYLCRHGMVIPCAGPTRGRGVQRQFSFGDIVVLKALARLLQAGVSVSRFRRALKALRVLHPEITQNGIPAAFLVTDGQEIFLKHKSGVVELLASGQLGFAFVIELESLRKEAVIFCTERRLRTDSIVSEEIETRFQSPDSARRTSQRQRR